MNVHIDLAIGAWPLRLWDDWLQNILVEVPQLLVLGAGDEDHAGRLCVEGRWDVLDDRGEDLLDALVRNWRLLLERVDRAAVGNGLEESVGTHFGSCVACGGLYWRSENCCSGENCL